MLFVLLLVVAMPLLLTRVLFVSDAAAVVVVGLTASKGKRRLKRKFEPKR